MTSSFIICTKDRLLDLEDCIKSITRQTVLPSEVIIVDASEDKISAENEKNSKAILGDKIKLIFLRGEPSTTRQRNIGIDHASGDIVFFLDDDVILEPDYHRKILEVYELKKDENIGGVMGSFNNYHKTKWIEICFRRLFLMQRNEVSGRRGRTQLSFNPIGIFKPKTLIRVEYMPGCICSYYRKVVEEFRFDEALDKYALSEDWDLSYRVSRKYILYQTPDATLFHKMSPVNRLEYKNLRRLQAINMHYLAQKHIPRRSLRWLAVYWGMIGYSLFFIVRGIIDLNFGEIKGFLEGIKYIAKKYDK